MNNILLGLFFLILGMLISNMLTNICGCKVVEGQTRQTRLKYLVAEAEAEAKAKAKAEIRRIKQKAETENRDVAPRALQVAGRGIWYSKPGAGYVRLGKYLTPFTTPTKCGSPRQPSRLRCVCAWLWNPRAQIKLASY